MKRVGISLTINGQPVSAEVSPRTHLADFMREHLGLTGTHLGCEHGVCGACTVEIDGQIARSCISYAVTCDGASVRTIESFDDDPLMIALRAAFSREHALQCGYCTPGMLVSARDLVKRLPDAEEQAIRIGMSGNLCRCTGYVGIISAVQSVISARRTRDIAAEPDAGRKMLGPVGSGHKTTAAATTTKLSPSTAAPSADAAVAIDAIPDFTPATVLEQHFNVVHPAQKVFAFFEDIAAVASCLPGASLTGTPTPERIDGAFRVRIGPISANFLGAARVERDPAAMSGRIVGVGRDQRSGSTTQGEIRYRLLPIEQGVATSVELSIGYSLTGLLAQIGRSGLVRDLAARLVADFASNLDRRLSGGASRAPAAAVELNGISLVFGLLRERAAKFVRRLTGQGGDTA